MWRRTHQGAVRWSHTIQDHPQEWRKRERENRKPLLLTKTKSCIHKMWACTGLWEKLRKKWGSFWLYLFFCLSLSWSKWVREKHTRIFTLQLPLSLFWLTLGDLTLSVSCFLILFLPLFRVMSLSLCFLTVSILIPVSLFRACEGFPDSALACKLQLWQSIKALKRRCIALFR